MEFSIFFSILVDCQIFLFSIILSLVIFSNNTAKRAVRREVDESVYKCISNLQNEPPEFKRNVVNYSPNKKESRQVRVSFYDEYLITPYCHTFFYNNCRFRPLLHYFSSVRLSCTFPFNLMLLSIFESRKPSFR